MARKLFGEFLGTAILVFVGVGAATLSFGDWNAGLLVAGAAGCSVAAGVVATALAFGLAMLILAYALGPISGAHVNPAVTIGFVASGRMRVIEGIGYWVAQCVGAIVGAAALYGIFRSSPLYSPAKTGLGADGWGSHSLIGIGWGGAFAAEAVLTFIFVLVVLTVTSQIRHAAASSLAIGLALGAVHLLGVPITGTGVNPARSLGPALLLGGDALAQLWLFLAAPLVGGIVAALVQRYLFPGFSKDAAAA